MENGQHRTSPAGFLVALGIIFGDIGTSPLYVFKAIVGDRPIDSNLVLGGMSCIFWTLTLLTTVKYVALTLRADNNGEGGIFSLFALVRRRGGWLLIPTVVGGSALLADGIITPPISVSSAIEGLRILDPHIPTVPIVILILVLLFSIQHLGTPFVGRSFGPVMSVWFAMLLVLGVHQVSFEPEILLAVNPYHLFHFITQVEGGFWLLGAVFLCTTGAEALYSDLGHCGRGNIRTSWTFVKTALLLNYFGQGAWLLTHRGELLDGRNPFYTIVPPWFLVPAILIATLATVIASQALISGSFTLATEAIRLRLFPKLKIVYPSELKGQIYVPALNWLLLIGCIGVVLFFRESSNMEAAYGLAITVTMLMTTLLLSNYLGMKRTPAIFVNGFLGIYLLIEGSFLVANLSKFTHGGWVTLIIGGLLSGIMWIWHEGSAIKGRYTELIDLEPQLERIATLSSDVSIPKYSTHLVYMTGAPNVKLIESKIVYSILQKWPKRADVYWFVHVDVLDEPYTTEYVVTKLIPRKVFRIDFRLGFRVEPRINLFFRTAIEELARNDEVDILSRYETLREAQIPGDFRFVVLEKFLSYENALPTPEKLVMDGYFLLKRVSLSEEKSFGLDTSSVTVEKVPLVISPVRKFQLRRVDSSRKE